MRPKELVKVVGIKKRILDDKGLQTGEQDVTRDALEDMLSVGRAGKLDIFCYVFKRIGGVRWAGARRGRYCVIWPGAFREPEMQLRRIFERCEERRKPSGTGPRIRPRLLQIMGVGNVNDRLKAAQ
ncbi:hypothetical protein H2201_008597 [Coniosporium apollinis]|uniref:Uncharacterized protein n=1 Tax=Coniosporium apollinis TaxID=61459 RepID=A0ABQ9NGK4_9PEZI|nr:hypothetical protein H2201_008597 [Coniosporium apollinis]